MTAFAFTPCVGYPGYKLYVQGSASNQANHQVRIVLAGIPCLTKLEAQTHESLENKFTASTEIPFFEISQTMDMEITLELMFNHQVVDVVSVGSFTYMAPSVPAFVQTVHHGLSYQHQASASASHESLNTTDIYNLKASEGSSPIGYITEPVPTQYVIPSSIPSVDPLPIHYPPSIHYVDPSPIQYMHSAPVQYVDPRAIMGSDWEESNASYFNGGSSSSNTGLLSPLLTPVLPPSILSSSSSSPSLPYPDQITSSVGPQRTTKKGRPAKATTRARYSDLHSTHSASRPVTYQPVVVAPQILSPNSSPHCTGYPSPEETHASLPITKLAPKPVKSGKVSDYEPPNTDFVSLAIATSVDDMTKDWTPAEIQAGRRLVRFTVMNRATDGSMKVHMCAISPCEYDDDTSLIDDTFSCIARPSGGHVMTSVDLIRLAGLLYGDGTENDEKGRLRRHLQRMEPETIGRKDDPEGIFDRISKLEKPRPLSIVKNVKLFDWSRLLDAMEFIVAKRVCSTCITHSSSAYQLSSDHL